MANCRKSKAGSCPFATSHRVAAATASVTTAARKGQRAKQRADEREPASRLCHVRRIEGRKASYGKSCQEG